MQTELFSQLENKIEQMIEEIELLRLEVSELKQEKSRLENIQQGYDGQLQRLINKLDNATRHN